MRRHKASRGSLCKYMCGKCGIVPPYDVNPFCYFWTMKGWHKHMRKVHGIVEGIPVIPPAA